MLNVAERVTFDQFTETTTSCEKKVDNGSNNQRRFIGLNVEL